MSSLAPVLEAFFTRRLILERNASPRTIAAYRDTFRLLLRFAQERTGKEPCALELTDVDAALVTGFLDYLERERNNNVRSRNARLAAVRSFFRFAALAAPEHAALIQRVLAIPEKRGERAVVTFLSEDEVDALLSVLEPSSWNGRRDRALLLVAVQTGLRVSELTKLRLEDVHLGTGPYLRCHGKGRKERVTPVTAAVRDVLKVWLLERGGNPSDPLFPTRQGKVLSTDAVEHLVTKYASRACEQLPSLRSKHVTPHTLRHTAAMRLLEAGVDTSVIALWLGHERVDTTLVYLHADLALKERALQRMTPQDVKPGRYRPPDSLLAFLEGL